MRRRTIAAAVQSDATRLTPAEAARIGELLHGRNGEIGKRALAAELGTSEYTINRALRRAKMRPETIARLRARLAARANQPSGIALTPDECSSLTTLVRLAGESAIASFFRCSPSTIASARIGRRARRATIARIREGLPRLESAFRSRADAVGEVLQ